MWHEFSNKDSVYAFKLGGRQCNYNHCYQKTCGIDQLKCVVCRTKKLPNSFGQF